MHGACVYICFIYIYIYMYVCMYVCMYFNQLDSILKSRDVTLPTKVHLVKTMVFPVVMYECESWTKRQVWPWSTKWSRAKANRVLPRELTGHSKLPLSTTQEQTKHGHHQVVNIEIRLIIFFAAKDGEALYSQQKQDQELTVAQIMNSLLPN